MMKLLKLLIPILSVLTFAAIVAWLVCAPNSPIGYGKVPSEICKKGDNPWDPGEEKDPHPKPHPKSIQTNSFRLILLCQKSGDDPWDPGDEAPTSKKEVRNA